MDSDKVFEVNTNYQHFVYLNPLRETNNGDNEYVQQYFWHDGNKWKLTNIALIYDIFFGEEYNKGPGTRRCRCSYYRSQLHVFKLYFDMELPINKYMSIPFKMIFSYNFYTHAIHKVITIWDTRRIFPCIDE